jgi:4-hydroxyphenylpyruvate dioxygenase
MNIDRVHFYVEDITRTREWFRDKIGLASLGHWVKDYTVTELVGNNALLFLISAPLNSLSPVANYLKIHPPGVADIGFQVKDILSFLKQTKRLGVNVIETYPPNQKNLQRLKIQGWGSVNHTITQERFSEKLKNILLKPQLMVTGIDHVVLNVASHEFESAIAWYRNLFNWEIQQTFEIKTNYSSLESASLIDSHKKIQFNINKPTSSNSQIQDFLDINKGAGIQHIGLRSSNIFYSVTQMKNRGVSFLSVPQTYYTQLSERYSQGILPFLSKKEWKLLEEKQILLDWQKDNPKSLLMQVFSHPIFSEPTFFFEIIERRKQAQGFGEGNFKALFEAVEREQLNRR